MSFDKKVAEQGALTDSLHVKYAVISGSGTGTTTLVPALAGKKIRIHGLVSQPGPGVDGYFASQGGTQLIKCAGLILPYCIPGWTETRIGEAFEFTQIAGGGAIGGCVIYSEI